MVKLRGSQSLCRPSDAATKQKVDEVLKDVMGGYELNAQWRAAYALCVVEARSREDDLKKLRLDPPEVTCLESTDAFYPRGNGRTNSLLSGRRNELPDKKLKFEEKKQQLDEKKQEKKERQSSAESR